MTRNRSPRVSVVVATWNRSALVRRLVAQLETQTLPADDLEVVVVDDGSAPPLPPFEPATSPAPRVTLVRQENAGPATARHRGILEAQGDLILLVDDDMSVDPDFVATHVRLHDTGVRRVVLGQIRPDPKLEQMPLFERFHAEMLERFATDVETGRLAVSGLHLCTGNVSFRRADYLAVGGFDPAFDRSEDAELGIRFEKAGLELLFSREAFTTHGSDHASLQVWMRRAFRYGINDRRIGWKHAETPGADPWRFLYLMHPLARPLLLISAFLPRAGRFFATVGMWCSTTLDRLGLRWVALAGTTVVYGMQYFRGVRHAAGSARSTAADLRAYAVSRRAEPTTSSMTVAGRAGRRFWLGRVPIDPLTCEGALDAIAQLVASRNGGTVFTPNVDHVVLAEEDAAFRAAYAQTSLSLIDGMPVLWASRLLGRRALEKASGSDLILPLAAQAVANGWRLYLVGGGPGVGEQAAVLLKTLHPDLVIAGIDPSAIDMSGPASGRAEVVQRADRARADLILVALGSPKGELWAAEARAALCPAVLVGIGAGLDFLVGAQKRAPAWMSRIGLEWLFRLKREPRRLWKRYLVRGPKFLPIAVRSILQSRWRP